MHLWLKRTGDVSLREQLVTQVVLGILGGELGLGQRLPSTRGLARRFGIHPNTVSAAFRELERDGWVDFRHGSGVFVAGSRPAAPLSLEMAVDQLVGRLTSEARRIGASPALVRGRLLRWLALEPPSRWLVIEPDPELRSIVMHEMQTELALPVAGISPGECSAQADWQGSLPVTLPSKELAVRKLLPPGTELTVLRIHPIAPELQSYLQRYQPLPAGRLVGIASRWGEFQRLARTMLVAAGIDPECLLVRDATRPGWKRGLEATVGVVCDSVTGAALPASVFRMRFTLLDAAFLAQLRAMEPAVVSENESQEG
jgi:DNA-binding transcriptional regulator YhcF (GntR family)